MDITLQSKFSGLASNRSRGTDLSMQGTSSSSNALAPSESVEEFLTPKKAQMRQEINQLRHDMQWNVHAAETFVRENELQSDEKAEAVLRAQQISFENIARQWGQQSQDHTEMEVASAWAQIEQEANGVFGELNKRFSQETAVMERGTS